MVTNMEHAETGGRLNYGDYSADVQEQARSRMALLRSLCVDAASTFVRSQVAAGNKYDGYTLWCGPKNRFTLRQALTTVGRLERIVAWPINEAIVRVELPKWESATQKFETRSGQPLTETPRIGFLRKSLGPTSRYHLRLSSHLLTDYNQVIELISEWDRFEGFGHARSNHGGQQPTDIG